MRYVLYHGFSLKTFFIICVGVDGAPYMLTVGLSMWTFGLYALTHLRTPTSRLVGYSGK